MSPLKTTSLRPIPMLIFGSRWLQLRPVDCDYRQDHLHRNWRHVADDHPLRVHPLGDRYRRCRPAVQHVDRSHWLAGRALTGNSASWGMVWHYLCPACETIKGLRAKCCGAFAGHSVPRPGLRPRAFFRLSVFPQIRFHRLALGYRALVQIRPAGRTIDQHDRNRPIRVARWSCLIAYVQTPSAK